MTNENVVPITAASKPSGPGASRPIFPGPDAPLDVARELYKAFRSASGLRTLVNYRGDWMSWNGQQWNVIDTSSLRAMIYKRLGQADYEKPIRKNGVIGDEETVPWNPNRTKIANVMEAMAAVGHLDATVDTPAWIGQHDGIDAPAARIVACTNGLLNLNDRTLHEHTPAYFNTVSVPFAYDPDAGAPQSWLRFLASAWPDDPDSIALLQEWFGYIVSGRTDMQKILFIVGPMRSGKGTNTGVLRKLIGVGNVTGPTLASLGTNFGLAPLIGKALAVVADARINGPVHVLVERLLSISGEDLLTVDRKFRDPWSGKLPTRITVMSNEVPRLPDASGAVASRMLVLQMRISHLGKEDRGLAARLDAELPGILNWALEGLDRLTSKGRFTVPKASNDATTMLADLASPVSAFVRERCVRGLEHSVARDRLFAAWKSWCDDNDHVAGSAASFGRDLRAAVPDLRSTQPRIAGKQIWHYTCIGLLPVSPMSDDEFAGQHRDSETGKPVSDPVSPMQGVLPDTTVTHPSEAVNQQVSATDTGDTGQTALQTQLCPTCQRHPARTESGLCAGCTRATLEAGQWLVCWIRANAGPGGWVKPADALNAADEIGYKRAAVKAARVHSSNPRIEASGQGRGSMWRIAPATEGAAS